MSSQPHAAPDGSEKEQQICAFTETFFHHIPSVLRRQVLSCCVCTCKTSTMADLVVPK